MNSGTRAMIGCAVMVESVISYVPAFTTISPYRCIFSASVGIHRSANPRIEVEPGIGTML